MIRLLTVLLVIALAAPAAFAAPVPSPYTASYSVKYRGISAGLLHFELRAEEPGRLVFQTRPEPGLFARAFVGPKGIERSVMQIDEHGIRPLTWFVDDGRSGQREDADLVFAWDKGVVRGTMKGEAVERPTEPGLQDRLSVQIAAMTALLRDDEPGTIPLLAEKENRNYEYTRVGTQRISTFAGEFDTVVYESTRPGSSRLSRVWHAPDLGFIPVRAEQLRNGRVETVMEMVKVNRNRS